MDGEHLIFWENPIFNGWFGGVALFLETPI